MNAEGRTRLRVVKFFETLGIDHPVFWEESWIVPYGSYFLEARRTEDRDQDWCVTLYYEQEEVVEFHTNVLNASMALDIREVIDNFMDTVNGDLMEKVYEVCDYIEQNFDCTLTPASPFSLKTEENTDFSNVERWTGYGEHNSTEYYIEIFLAPHHNPILSLAKTKENSKTYHEIRRDSSQYKTVLVDFFGAL